MRDAKSTNIGVKALILIVAEVQEHYPRMELSQLAVLLRILEKPGIKATDLAQRTGLSKSALSRAVRVLGSEQYKADGDGKEKLGLNLISQVPDPFDKRASLVAPTRLGRRLGDEIDRIVGDARNGTLTGEALDS